MEHDSQNSADEEEALVRELAREYIRHHRVLGENGAQRQNQNGLREYMSIVKEIIALQVRETVHQYAVSIVKSIFIIMIIIIFSHLFNCEWIPGILAVIVMIATGLRFIWLQWHGMGDAVIRIPIDIYMPNT